MLRTLVLLRKLYKYFSENKSWILSILFVCSIIRASLWYALFGINILIYSTLQDLFINFAEYFMSIITIALTYILCRLIYNTKSRILKIISISFFILLFILYNIIFRIIMPILFIIFVVLFIYLLYEKQKKAEIIGYTSILFLCLTLEQPLEQYAYIYPYKSDKRAINNVFIEKPANYDTFSFEYSNMIIHTDSEQFYYIGGNSNYYFILDRKQNEVMIIPKSECSNIKGSPLSIKKISNMFS